jgi:hypothetical protein
MISFFSIINYSGGMASYHVRSEGREGYVASLVRSTAASSVPEEISIPTGSVEDATGSDPLRNSIVQAIKRVEADLDGTS